MDIFEVNVEERKVSSKGAIRKLKSEGFVPGVLYSEGRSTPISLNEHEMKNILDKHGKDVFLKVYLGGLSVKARIQEVQRDPVNQDIQHIDLIPVNDRILH